MTIQWYEGAEQRRSRIRWGTMKKDLLIASQLFLERTLIVEMQSHKYFWISKIPRISPQTWSFRNRVEHNEQSAQTGQGQFYELLEPLMQIRHAIAPRKLMSTYRYAFVLLSFWEVLRYQALILVQDNLSFWSLENCLNIWRVMSALCFFEFKVNSSKIEI